MLGGMGWLGRLYSATSHAQAIQGLWQWARDGLRWVGWWRLLADAALAVIAWAWGFLSGLPAYQAVLLGLFVGLLG
jgi:hypothetical protein